MHRTQLCLPTIRHAPEISDPVVFIFWKGTLCCRSSLSFTAEDPIEREPPGRDWGSSLSEPYMRIYSPRVYITSVALTAVQLHTNTFSRIPVAKWGPRWRLSYLLVVGTAHKWMGVSPHIDLGNVRPAAGGVLENQRARDWSAPGSSWWHVGSCQRRSHLRNPEI